MQHVEVELKFPLHNSELLIATLSRIATAKKHDEYQKDTYLTPEHRDFLKKKPVSEWLRIRESGRGASINYKRWHNDNGEKTVSCDEYETKVENVTALKKILQSLNMRELIIVEKTRNTWSYKDAEIAVDHIKELGNFIEIEAKGEFVNVEDAKKHLYRILDELDADIGEQDFEGYPYLLLKKKGLL